MRRWLLIFFLSFPTVAFGNGFQFSSFTPAADSLSYLSVWSPKTLHFLDWEVGTAFHFQYRPFQLHQNGSRVRSVLEHLWTQHITGAVGLVDRWVEIGVDLPIAWRYSFTDPNVVAATSTSQTSLGDLRLHLKTNLVNLASDALRVGILSTVSLPTGNANHFLGDDKAAFTETLLLETSPSSTFSLALNIGFEIRPDFTLRDINKTEQLKLGLGGQLNLAPRVQLLAEATTQTRLAAPFENVANSPTELATAVRYLFKDTGIAVTAGTGFGLTYGAGAPLVRGFVSCAYLPALAKTQFVPQLDGLLSNHRR